MSDPFHYHQILSRFYNRALLLRPTEAETISSFLLSREFGARRRSGSESDDKTETRQYFPAARRDDGSVEAHSPRTSRFYGNVPFETDEQGNRAPTPYRRTKEGVALITLVGEFVNRGAWIGASSGLISYEGFKFQMLSAAQDSKAKVILLDLESPGGEAVGAFEAAAVVREVAKIKPVVALVNGMAASAAYAIASGASRIVTIPTGISGSIGVVMMHLDISKALAEQGVKPTLIFAGAHKVDGNAFEPLPEDVRADFQREIDGFYGQFVQTVAAGRKGMSDKAIRATEARVFKGQEAVDAGLADSVGTFEEVLAELSRGSTSGRSTQPIDPKGPQMDNTTGASASLPADISLDTLRASHPTLAASLMQAGMDAERQRIAGIEAVALPGHEALIAEMKADGKTTPEQAAARIVQAERALRETRAQGVRDVETVTGALKSAPTVAGPVDPRPGAVAATPDGWTAEWKASAELQERHDTAEAYVSYQQGVASGRIRILSRKSA
ncbi:MAG: S49 family peptidase [Pseudorhodoplanes sp.]|uniref:S49 family peptidase n=1 Tax=Pseudorhodoplanes sp. TaxID=1934341 RepID=UPI003D131C55